MRHIRVQAEDFDTGTELARLNLPGAGGLASFIGIVREGEPKVSALELEHYPGMTERALEAIAQEAAQRWQLLGCTIIHRIGRLEVGAQIVLVAAASAHRAHALQAAGFIIDYLKTAAPFWKREIYADGQTAWVEMRQEDKLAADGWKKIPVDL